MALARANEAARIDGLRKNPTVRAIARAWRELTGGTARDRDLARRTLIACSSGADSSGLALALAAAVSRPAEVFVLAHIVHDMRSRAEALADRDAAKTLSERLGLSFVQAEVKVKAAKGNAEAAARTLRYQALEQLATEHNCPYIAIAHHADDQLETMLMALVRGTGPRGLAGMPSRRRAGKVRIIRPALSATRMALQDVCRAAGWTWREDATNTDESKLRAAIRHRIIPELERLRPGASVRASQTASLLRGAAALISARVAGLLPVDGKFTWNRASLRTEPGVVLGDLIKLAASSITSGIGQDRLSRAAVGRIVRAIKDAITDPREFTVGGVRITVTSKAVTIGECRD